MPPFVNSCRNNIKRNVLNQISLGNAELKLNRFLYFFRACNTSGCSVILKESSISQTYLTIELPFENTFLRIRVLRSTDPESLDLHVVLPPSHFITEEPVQSGKWRMYFRYIRANFGKEVTEWDLGSKISLPIYLPVRTCSRE